MKRKWIVLSAGSLVITVVVVGLIARNSDNGPTPSQGCAETTVAFDIASLEKIRRTPEVVLADVRGFWETEAPYIAAKRWEPPGYPIHYGEFERVVSELAALDEVPRAEAECFDFAKRIFEAAPEFRASALSSVCSYLPEETVLEANVLLACFIYLGDPDPRFRPSAFVAGDDIVVNASSGSWNSQVNDVLHMLIHEVYHVGYHGHQRTLPLQDAETSQEMVDHILWQLQNEGMATYVAYKARTVFPTSEDEEDYRLLDDPQQVEYFLGEVNDLLQQAITTPPAELSDAVIERGITKRAFYVVGAHMARSIEVALGREALVSAVRDGAAAFAELYDSIAEDDRKIRSSAPVGMR